MAKGNKIMILGSPYDNIEIHSCRALDRKGEISCYRDGFYFEQCEPDDKDKVCDAVYFHLKAGGIQHVADFKTRSGARRFAAGLGRLMGFEVDEYKTEEQDMEQRIVMFEPAGIDRAADAMARLLKLDPALASDDREFIGVTIENLRQQLGSSKTDTPVLNSVISAWTVEDIVDAAGELETAGKGGLTVAEINAVAEKLRRNQGDVSWDDIYHEIGRFLAEKGKPVGKQKKKPRAPIRSGRKASMGDFLVWATGRYDLWYMEDMARNDGDDGWRFQWRDLPRGIADADILKAIPSRKYKK